MAVTSDSPAPYAPPSVIIDLIERHRSRGLPSPVTAEVLGRASVAESLIPRTIQSLQALDLINEDSQPTATFEGIRKASNGEYKQRLAAWLNGTYSDVIKFVDPAKDDEVAVRDAFRNYNPVGQQPRMVSLFLGLYAAAGVRPERAPSQRQPRPRIPAKQQSLIPRKSITARSDSGIPAALAGLLSNLPPEGKGWTQVNRDKFLTTFEAVLDFYFPIVERGETEEVPADDA